MSKPVLILVTCERCEETSETDDNMRFYRTDSGVMCELCMEDIEDE